MGTWLAGAMTDGVLGLNDSKCKAQGCENVIIIYSALSVLFLEKNNNFMTEPNGYTIVKNKEGYIDTWINCTVFLNHQYSSCT